MRNNVNVNKSNFRGCQNAKMTFLRSGNLKLNKFNEKKMRKNSNLIRISLRWKAKKNGCMVQPKSVKVA